jgi:hypothetical protein
VTLAIALSLVAAFLFAGAAVLQQRGTEGVADADALGAGFLTTLVHRPIWLLGIAADIAGFGVQAAALAVGSLLLVQPLLVTTLLFALPMAARFAHRRLTEQEWRWSGLLALSLVVFVVMGEPTSGRQAPSFSAWLPTIVVVVPLVAACVFAASGLPHGTRRSLVLAIAAGVLLGVSAPLTKSAIAAFGDGLLAGLGSWEFWAMALAASLGTFWQQSSYQAGDVQTSLPAVTVLKPLVAMALGLTIYDETLKIGGVGDLLLLASIGTMVWATLVLGRLAAPELADPPPSPSAAS